MLCWGERQASGAGVVSVAQQIGGECMKWRNSGSGRHASGGRAVGAQGQEAMLVRPLFFCPVEFTQVLPVPPGWDNIAVATVVVVHRETPLIFWDSAVTRKQRTTISTTDDNNKSGKKGFRTSSAWPVPSTCPSSSDTPHSTSLRRAGSSSLVDWGFTH